MRRIISMLMENEPGALSRVVGLFSQRNYNINSLTVAPTDDLSLSRLNFLGITDKITLIPSIRSLFLKGESVKGKRCFDLLVSFVLKALFNADIKLIFLS